MTDQATFLPIDRSDLRKLAQFDAKLSIARVLGQSSSDDDAVWEATQRVAELVERFGDERAAAEAVGVELTPAVALALLASYVYHEAWNAVLRLTSVIEPAESSHADDAIRLQWIWSCAAGLAWLEQADDSPTDPTWSAPELAADFRRLAAVEQAAGRPETALACALSAVNLSGESDETEESVEFALRLTASVGDVNAALPLKTHQAIARARACHDDASKAPAAFDACESVLRHATWEGDAGAASLNAVAAAVRGEPRLNGLLALVAGALDTEQEDKELGRTLRAFAQPCWETSWKDVDPLPRALWTVAVLHEDQRLSLLPKADDAVAAEASWVTWAFEHPMFRRSIPHGLSMQRTRGLDETMLVLVHETTHVLSMIGGLGVAVAALRLALLEVELGLWTFAGPLDPEAMRLVGVAPLIHGAAAALPQAEQALELSRKLHTLQGVWGPWFEGVALFGEIAATSPNDPFNATVTQVLANLIDDEPLDVTAAQGDITVPEEIARRQGIADEAFLEAGRSLGPARLHYILQRHPSKYLAGYLAVRSLVTAWRETTGGELDLPTAFRLLLHLTRHGTLDAIPDLALSADAFREQAMTRMCSWIRAAASIDAVALDRFRRPEDATDATWRQGDGRLVLEVAEPTPVELRPMVERALLTLTGEHANRERIDDPDPCSAALVDAAAESLKLQTLSWIEGDPDLADRMLARVPILPIGRCYAPFWLTRDGVLIALIRTADGPSAEDNARHQLIRASLEPEAAAGLRDEMRKRRDARMSIVRVADLTELQHFPEFRGAGSNYLTFVYGEWIHVEHRGMLTGARAPISSSLTASISARLFPNWLIDIESAHTSGGAGAERTARWLAESHSWTLDGSPFDATAFVTHLEAVAAAMLDPQRRDDDANAAATRMLALLVAPPQAETLQREGLQSLSAVRREYPGKLLSALAATAFEPTESEFLDQHWPAIEPHAGALFEYSERGWDVRPIGGSCP